MVKYISGKRLRYRIYQAGFRGLIKAIEGKCLEKGVAVAKTNPRRSSPECPLCASPLVRGPAPRRAGCPKCNIEIGRDVVAKMDHEMGYLASKGCVPSTPMPYEPALEVAVLPMKMWAGRNSLDETMNLYRNDWNDI